MPRLALYSDQLPPLTDVIDERVRAWLPAGGTVGYLPASPDPGRTWFEPRRAYYARLGLELRHFELETGQEPGEREALLGCDAIHLSGGNTFRFLYWLRARALIDDLRSYATRGGVLIGVSAGAILMTREVATAALCGDVPYEGIDGGAGLGLVDFAFVPHFDGSETMTDALRTFSRGFAGEVHAVRDGEGLVVDGETVISYRSVLR